MTEQGMLWLPLVGLVLAGQGQDQAQSQPAGVAAAVAPAARQSAIPNLDDPVRLDDVEVEARRGAARVPPETELDGARIDELDAHDIGEVIRRLTQDYALGDAPLIIVNGRRMADPQVFSGFPPDALVRAEILPSQAGGLYGSTDPSQRVVNIVLQPRFHSADGRATFVRPTAGGRTGIAAVLRRSTIVESSARNLSLQVDRTTALRASERGRSRPEDEDVTLRAGNQGLSVDLARTATLGDWGGSLNVNAGRQQTNTVFRSGDDETVESRLRSQSLSATGGLNGDLAGWAVRGTLNGRISASKQSGVSSSDSQLNTISAGLGLGRTLFDLPAGPATVSLAGGASRSSSVRESPSGRSAFSGRFTDLNGSLSVPLARRGDGGTTIPFLGDLALTLAGNLNEMDAGRGSSLSTGLSWVPWQRLRLNGTWSTSNQSLPDEQRFAPEYYGEPITVFDFERGEAVEIVPLLGGNPDLRAPSLDRIALSVSAGPFTSWGLQTGVNFHRTEAVDGIGALGDLTPEMEAAFPERFQRDENGRLVGLDFRPINFGFTLTETLTSNANFRIPLSKGGRRTAPTLGVGFNHSWWMTDIATLYPGRPTLDRLAGDGGGMSRHQIAARADVRLGNWGLNAMANWRSAFRIRRDSGRNGPNDLVRADFTTIDLKLSYLLEPRALQEEGARSRHYDGVRLELAITNLFDTRPHSILGDGRPAPGYGRDDQDPLGRVAQLTLSKRF